MIKFIPLRNNNPHASPPKKKHKKTATTTTVFKKKRNQQSCLQLLQHYFCLTVANFLNTLVYHTTISTDLPFCNNNTSLLASGKLVLDAVHTYTPKLARVTTSMRYVVDVDSVWGVGLPRSFRVQMMCGWGLPSAWQWSSAGRWRSAPTTASMFVILGPSTGEEGISVDINKHSQRTHLTFIA